MSDLCDVSSIALGDAKYYTHIKNAYRQRFEAVAGNAPSISSATHPKLQKKEPIDSGSAFARTAMTSLFSAAKRG